MSVTLIQTGDFVLLAKCIYRKEAGIWCFRRRIPDDVLKHYPGRKGDIRFSPKIRDESEAASLANQYALGQDAQWTAIRTGQVADGPERVRAAEEILRSFGLKSGDGREIDEVGAGGEDFFAELDYQAGIDPMGTPEENIQRQKDLPAEYRLAAKLLNGEPVPLFLSEALNEFQSLKGESGNTKTAKDRMRVVSEFMRLYGDLPIGHYTRDHANEYVKHLLDKGNKPTLVRRRINSISADFTLMEAEGKLNKRSIFRSIQIPKLGEDRSERKPFILQEIREIQSDCFEQDDEMRWKIAFMLDTGFDHDAAIL